MKHTHKIVQRSHGYMSYEEEDTCHMRRRIVQRSHGYSTHETHT